MSYDWQLLAPRFNGKGFARLVRSVAKDKRGDAMRLYIPNCYLPSVRDVDLYLSTDGSACRVQVSQSKGRRVTHPTRAKSWNIAASGLPWVVGQMFDVEEDGDAIILTPIPA